MLKQQHPGCSPTGIFMVCDCAATASVINFPLLIYSCSVSLVKSVCDLTIYIDSDLMMWTHVKRTVSQCFTLLRRLRQIRHLVPTATLQMLVVTLVHSRLDYGNSVLVGLPAYLLHQLQLVMNAATHLVYHLRAHDHITDSLI